MIILKRLCLFLLISALLASCNEETQERANEWGDTFIPEHSATSEKLTTTTENKSNSNCLNIVNAHGHSQDPNIRLMIVQSGPDSLGLCTATLIHPRVAVTAAHCIPVSGKNGVTLVKGFDLQNTANLIDAFNRGDKPASIQTLGKWGDEIDPSSDTLRQQDFAILTFNQDIGDDFYQVSTNTPTIGSSVDVKGFGYTTFEPIGNTNRLQRYGSNTLTTAPNSSLLAINASNGDSFGAKGDSGGPLLFEDKIIGVYFGRFKLSLLDGSEKAFGLYVSLNDPRIQQLISETLASLSLSGTTPDLLASTQNETRNTNQPLSNFPDVNVNANDAIYRPSSCN